MAPAPTAHPGRVTGALVLALTAAVTYLAFAGPIPLEDPGPGDALYFLLLALHGLWGGGLLLRRPRYGLRYIRRFVRVPEFLLSYALLLFLFAYFFALNANMDYVQRFIESGGNLRLAVDSTTERAIAVLRYVPFLALDGLIYLYLRLRHYRVVAAVERRLRVHRRGRLGPERAGRAVSPTGDFARVWGLTLVYLSVFLSTASFPSFISLDGFPALGWISLVPLFLVLRAQSFARGVFYSVVYGVFTTLLVNYWLATFSLVSLQSAVVIFFGFYLLFMPPALLLYHGTRRLKFLVLPLAWTAFELARSSGFLGYPWALVGHSQYQVVPLLQIASVTGVWGVSFLVVLASSALAHVPAMDGRRFRAAPVLTAVLALGVALGAGQLTLLDKAPRISDAAEAEVERTPAATRPAVTPEPVADGAAAEEDSRVRVALVQQNSDPRKHEYRRTLGSLRRLTDEALEHDPDLVVWSETAFVPNIRRWSREDPERYRLARLVDEFLAYQSGIGTHLLTGNDDYRRVLDDEGNEVDRLSFNAAVFFGSGGTRLETYHKIRLVPFTEYFPFEESLPEVYELLQEFDVHFWEPGEEKTVFEHPRMRFSTPICFEDMFPGEVRGFVRNGAQVIVNLSNDYWSLTPVQAKQHFAGGMFRSVENRRPVVRATASGLTAHVDRWGRILRTAPFYEEAFLVTDVRVPSGETTTPYTRYGDWFPVAAGAAAFLLFALSVPAHLRDYRSPEAVARRRLERERREFLHRKLVARRRRARFRPWPRRSGRSGRSERLNGDGG
ncbi:MAG: apolipoprotein N-acyltransferase [Spirochaetaceae bacterium]